ncbi:hypothetical protein [Leadbettera azotonutricia]|uniref:DUF4129 domain-containing protein n=1 Tax=Leadbettera azotonutricia (strain ATCC BAA-888 / DSM 13862 / ZAS-9) TaxID=545695 RepID=F5YE25_LEAAZ|nr:hypothetical protein [Leadbettera azotonutricia]AEF81560.1 conserved hypothetical protein [Leadbettera azotonutricia ZAS-9]
MTIPNLDSALVLRRRNAWEAADSGLLLWRENFLYLIPVFAIPVWVAACGLRFIPEHLRWLSWVALWWLKPLFDRLALQVVSSRFFGGRVMKGFWGNFCRGLMGDLLWRRFSPFRSASMPLRILERLKHKQYRKRKKALGAGGLDFCFLLSILGLIAEAGLLGGESIFTLATVEILFPNISYSFWDNLVDTELLLYIGYCFNYIIVETMYVCMGFGLYINSRVEVEGWDLQILFQKFTRKLAAGAKVLLLVCGLLLFVFPLNAQEEEAEKREYFPEGFMLPDSYPRHTLDEILESDDFGGYKDGWKIRLKNENDDEADPLPEIDLAPWVKTLKEIFAFALRLLIILVVAAFAVFALLRLYKIRSSSSPGKRSRGKAYIESPASPGNPESLFGKAEEFFRHGNIREAWAACLSGTIGSYALYRDVSFPPDATEYGCLRIVRSCVGMESEQFAAMVQDWVSLAYGGRLPQEGKFEQALEFGRNVSTNTANSPGDPIA